VRVLRRLLNVWRGRTLARDFDDEIAFHIEQRIDANLRRGLTREDAIVEAQRHFGSVIRAREGMREARVAEWIPAFGRDLRVALRMARRQPGLAALTMITLSLGVGATASVFALIDGMLIRPLPYHDADRLVTVGDTFRTGPPRTGPTIPELLDVRAAATVFEGLSWVDWRDFQIGGGTEPARVMGARAEVALLQVLGVTPALGRLFTEADATPGQPPVAILTDGLWRTNFAADAAIVGKRIVLNGLPTEVVGVLPAGFQFDFFAADPVDLYVPYPMIAAYTSRTAEFANVRRVIAVGRLKRGVAQEQADAEVVAVARRIEADHADLYRIGADRRDVGFAMHAEPLQRTLFAGSERTATLLSTAAALLLLIACVNMGQFLLAHALERRTEIAVRSALGASRVRLVRQLAAESLVLAAIAAAGGLLQAEGFIYLLRMYSMSQDPFVASRIELNGSVALFTIGTAAVVASLCNLVALVRWARPAPLHALATRELAPPTRARYVLLAGQVAVAVTFLAITGLLVHSITRLNAGDRGYTTDDVISLRLRAVARLQGPAVGEMYRRYLERLRAIPDIEAVAIANAQLPLFPSTNFAVDGGRADAATLSAQRAAYTIISPDYFKTLGIPVRSGRTFTDDDRAGRPPVAIVNEELAHTFWPGQQVIGRQVRAGEGPRSALMTIVGVVGNVRPAMQLEPIPQVYVSLLQQPEPIVTMLIRSRQGRPVPLESIKQAVWSVTPDQPLFDVRLLSEWLTTFTAEPRRSLAVLLGSGALLAVFISGAGMFTLVTYVTVRRRREIALRRAIGAGVRDVVRLVSAPTIRWTCVGLLVGLVAATSGSGILRANFAGVAPTEPALLAIVSALYLAIGCAAVWAPALSALRDDPAEILRSE
jgi:putative ABC transport system permease protein